MKVAQISESTEDLYAPKTEYDAVDDDAVDQLLKKYLSKNVVELTVSRLQEGLYQIGEKTLTMRIDKENEQVLEVRVGSTWIKLDDHLKNIKHREEFTVQADLDD